MCGLFLFNAEGRGSGRILGPSETQALLDLGAIFVYAVHVGSLFFLIEWHLEKSYAL